MNKLISMTIAVILASLTQVEAADIFLTCNLAVNDEVADGKEIELVIDEHRVIERGEDQHATWIEIGTRHIKFVEENRISRWVWRIDRETGVFTIDKFSSSFWGTRHDIAVGRCVAKKFTPRRF
jgi:hypothetical protein